MCFQFDSTTIANRVFGKREKETRYKHKKNQRLRKAIKNNVWNSNAICWRIVLNQGFTVENLGEAALAVVRVCSSKKS